MTRRARPRILLAGGTGLVGRELSPDRSGPRRMQILGTGRQQTRGYYGAGISDMEGLERTIRVAVEDAERREQGRHLLL